MKRALIILALVALVALPFALRPKADAARKTDDTVVVITPHNEAIRHEYALGFAAWYQRRTTPTPFPTYSSTTPRLRSRLRSSRG